MPYKSKEQSRERARGRKQKQRMSRPDVTPMPEGVTKKDVTPSKMSRPDVTPDEGLMKPGMEALMEALIDSEKRKKLQAISDACMKHDVGAHVFYGVPRSGASIDDVRGYLGVTG